MSEHAGGAQYDREAEDAAAEALAERMAPDVMSQHAVVGRMVTSFATVGSKHSIILDNYLKLSFDAQIEMSVLKNEDEKKLTGESVHEHFKQLEEGR